MIPLNYPASFEFPNRRDQLRRSKYAYFRNPFQISEDVFVYNLAISLGEAGRDKSALQQQTMIPQLLGFILISLASAAHVSSDHDEKVLQASDPDRSYHLGERFQVECLNRTLESGEHVSWNKTMPFYSYSSVMS